MSLEFVDGDIFEAPTQTIVNTVNTKGVMGKGLALAFKKRYPKMFKDYRERCLRGEVHVGEPYLYASGRRWIVNFPTKDDWRKPSKLAWIRAGLEYFAQHYVEWGVESIAFPQLGTLNGRLKWDDVRGIMQEILGPLGIRVCVYSFNPAAAAHESAAASTAQQPRLL
jgi:O-acetyl-ADP-ribose deacetylase (regulator of RNase III)